MLYIWHLEAAENTKTKEETHELFGKSGCDAGEQEARLPSFLRIPDALKNAPRDRG